MTPRKTPLLDRIRKAQPEPRHPVEWVARMREGKLPVKVWVAA